MDSQGDGGAQAGGTSPDSAEGGVSQPDKFCPRCGARSPYYAVFCMNCGANFAQISPVRDNRPLELRRAAADMLTGRWLKIVLLAFVIELGLFFYVSSLHMSAASVQYYSQQGDNVSAMVRQMSLPFKVTEIFLNNFRIALFEFVPLFGWLIFGESVYVTARIIEAFALANNPPLPGAAVMISLLLLPHSWLELPAYSLAVTQSFFLILYLATRRPAKALNTTLVALIFTAVELLVAAIFESVEIQLEYSSTLPFLTWIPFFGLLFGFYAFVKRLSKSRGQESQVSPSPS